MRLLTVTIATLGVLMSAHMATLGFGLHPATCVVVAAMVAAAATHVTIGD